MNNLYLEPWETLQVISDTENNIHWYRFRLNNRNREGSIASITPMSYGGYAWSASRQDDSYAWSHPFPTLQIAMEMCDQMLLSWGYNLLTKEQVDKLLILL
jgi:hypothetical protein